MLVNDAEKLVRDLPTDQVWMEYIKNQGPQNQVITSR